MWNFWVPKTVLSFNDWLEGSTGPRNCYIHIYWGFCRWWCHLGWGVEPRASWKVSKHAGSTAEAPSCPHTPPWLPFIASKECRGKSSKEKARGKKSQESRHECPEVPLFWEETEADLDLTKFLLDHPWVSILCPHSAWLCDLEQSRCYSPSFLHCEMVSKDCYWSQSFARIFLRQSMSALTTTPGAEYVIRRWPCHHLFY